MCEPQLVDIVRARHRTVLGVEGRAYVCMAYDEAGLDKLAGAVDLVIAGMRPPGGIDDASRRSHLFQRRDPSILDHEISRPPWRRSGPIDDRGAAQDQAVIRSATAF